ncbi:hypothetical protein M407DRAFT_208366 [Tulasnella calospora MUT 4182]|uniref:Uncharacterized protein n=1 Tax=Tulasnella calospora MUT 4182 TaxID=1051891 RepID=A0A0C3PMQ2_9AGAM|nr:hypothetical protein M407DRAFT_208366 [Tulasnella calospora MUT 4182]
MAYIPSPDVPVSRDQKAGLPSTALVLGSVGNFNLGPSPKIWGLPQMGQSREVVHK